MELAVHLDDLSALPDDELYVLEGRRSLDPADWRRVDDELRRRRHLRVHALADVADTSSAQPTPTLSDLERVASSLAVKLASTEREVRRLRWWVVLTPVLWVLLAAGSIVAAQTFGAGPKP